MMNCKICDKELSNIASTGSNNYKNYEYKEFYGCYQGNPYHYSKIIYSDIDWYETANFETMNVESDFMYREFSIYKNNLSYTKIYKYIGLNIFKNLSEKQIENKIQILMSFS